MTGGDFKPNATDLTHEPINIFLRARCLVGRGDDCHCDDCTECPFWDGSVPELGGD